MRQAMDEGTVLFRDGTIFPEALQCEIGSSPPGWRSSKEFDGYGLDRKFQNEGWHFFYFPGESKVTVVGREGEKTTRKAIKRIQASLKFEKINSFEITRMAFKTFLGIPYMSLSFHTRNSQERMLLPGGETSQPWIGARLTTAR
jgi:hypothetical protein